MTKKKGQQRQNFSKGTSLEKNWITEDAQKKILKVREELGLVKEKDTPRFLITTKGTCSEVRSDVRLPESLGKGTSCSMLYHEILQSDASAVKFNTQGEGKYPGFRSWAQARATAGFPWRIFTSTNETGVEN
jgi:hypothetical protein